MIDSRKDFGGLSIICPPGLYGVVAHGIYKSAVNPEFLAVPKVFLTCILMWYHQTMAGESDNLNTYKGNDPTKLAAQKREAKRLGLTGPRAGGTVEPEGMTLSTTVSSNEVGNEPS
jgi:hypothetical protein